MATLTYDLAIIGRAAIERELASLERRFAQHAARVNKAAGVGAGGSSTTSSKVSGATSSAERSAAKAMRDRVRMVDQVRKMEQTLNAEKQRAIDRQLRSQSALGRQRIREEREVRRERERFAQGRSDFVRSTVGAGTGRVMRGLASVGSAGASMLGLGGAALAANAVHSAIGLDERTRRLSIMARDPGKPGIDPQNLRRQFVQTGLATGFSAEDIAAGVEKYTAETGDMGTALANQRVLSTAAQAHGAKVEEIFAAAAHLKKLDLTGVEDMQKAFAILGQQGKKGSFELRAMAKEFPEILSNAANIGVRGVEGVKDVGAIAQIAKQASGSDAEASTALQNFFRKFGDEAKNLQSGKTLGGKKVQVFEGGDPRNKMLPFMDVFDDFMMKSEGDLTAFQKAFDIRGSKAGNPLLNEYREARDKTLKEGGTREDANKQGIGAVRAYFSKFRNVNADWGEVQRDAADAMKSTSVQLENLNTQFKEVIGSKLLPELNKLIPVLGELIPKFAALVSGVMRLAQWFADNPLKAVIAALAISIGFEVTKAKIGATLKAGLERLMALGTNEGGGDGGPGGGTFSKLINYKGTGTSAATGATMAGTLGAMATGLSAGLTVGTLIATVGIAKFENSQAEMKDSGTILNRIRGAGTNDLEMVKELVQTLRTREREARAGSWTDFITGDEDRKQIIETQAGFRQEAEAKLEALKMQSEAAKKQMAAADAQKQAADALTNVASTMGGNKPNTSDKPTGVKWY